MALLDVQVTLLPGDNGEVLIDGEKLPGVTAVHVTGSVRNNPHVTITLAPNRVLARLPETAVTVLRPGGAAEFADGLNPARLQAIALEYLDANPDMTHGEAFAQAVVYLAGESEDD